MAERRRRQPVRHRRPLAGRPVRDRRGRAARVRRPARPRVRLAEAEQPDIAVLIDSWEFTWRVARRLRLRAPRLAIVKYVAPQVWATRPGRARVLARPGRSPADPARLRGALLRARGPADHLRRQSDAAAATSPAPIRRGLRAAIEAGPDDPILLVLPGSRPGEIKRVMPAFEDAALRLKRERPRPASGRAGRRHGRRAGQGARRRLAAPRPRGRGRGGKLDAMAAATLALACSGTVTSELARAGCPMVVGYRGHPLTALVARMVIRVPYLTLINIAAGEAVAPEFLQERLHGPEARGGRRAAARRSRGARRPGRRADARARQAGRRARRPVRRGRRRGDRRRAGAGAARGLTATLCGGRTGRYSLWIGSIQRTASGFSTGSMSRFTTTASLSLRTSTHSSVSSAEALISWCGTNGGT